MDVVVLRPLREGREEHPERRGGGDPQRELVAAMAHEVHIRHRPQQVEHVDGIPRRPVVNVGDDPGVEHKEREHEVKGIAIGRAEDGEVPECRVVPPVDSGVQALEAMQQGVDGKEVGVVEHHNSPRELETPQNVTRELTSAYKPMSAGREEKREKVYEYYYYTTYFCQCDMYSQERGTLFIIDHASTSLPFSLTEAPTEICHLMLSLNMAERALESVFFLQKEMASD